MTNGNHETVDQVRFNVSESSAANSRWSRYSIWLGAGLAIAVIFFPGGFSTWKLIAGLFVVAFFYALDLYVRQQADKAGQAWVTLTSTAIEASSFSTKLKCYDWSEIEDATLQVIQGVPRLELRLKSRPGRPDKRKFLIGRNPARPLLMLTPLEPRDQEALMAAIARHIHGSDPTRSTEAGTAVSALREERLFQERLIAMMPQTWATYALIGINVLVWLVTVALGTNFLQAQSEQLFRFGGNVASEVQQGQWWRMLTATLLHGGLMHLVMNMLGLYAVGMTVERIYGRVQFLLIYFGAALVGSAASLHFSAQHAVSVGASGAVFGVAGALFVAMYLNRSERPKVFGKQTISSLSLFMFYSLLQGFSKSGIDNAAHVGGLMAGVVLAALLPARFDLESYHRVVARRLPVGIVFVVLATVAGAMTAPTAAIDVRARFVASAAFERGVTGFQREIKLLQQEQKDKDSGKITEIETDQRSRTVFAPRWRSVVADLNQANFPVDDPRAPLASTMAEMARLILESLEMESIVVDGKPTPVDPGRTAAIDAELNRLGARLAEIGKRLQNGPKKP